MKLGRGRK